MDPENREEHLKRLAEAGIHVQKMMDIGPTRGALRGPTHIFNLGGVESFDPLRQLLAPKSSPLQHRGSDDRGKDDVKNQREAH